MRISVRVKPKSKHPAVSPGDGGLIVSVAEAPTEGAANRAVIRALAKHFDVPQSSITLVSGSSGRHKIFEVPLSA